MVSLAVRTGGLSCVLPPRRQRVPSIGEVNLKTAADKVVIIARVRDGFVEGSNYSHRLTLDQASHRSTVAALPQQEISCVAFPNAQVRKPVCGQMVIDYVV